MVLWVGLAHAAEYETPESQRIVERMLDAHGGFDTWKSKDTVAFHSHLKVHFGNDNWVPFWEEATVEIPTRRVYAVLPNPDGTSGRIAFDGSQAWSAGELRGIARAPARFTAWRNFYLFHLPWMTQDPGVRLAAPTTEKLALLDQNMHAIRMTFESGVGDTPKDFYVLYIDPETYQLRAAEYVMTYASMMQGGAEASPASIFVWEETATVEGLLVPTRYSVYWSADGSLAVKDGEISEWSFGSPFDPKLLEIPPDGVADTSQPVTD